MRDSFVRLDSHFAIVLMIFDLEPIEVLQRTSSKSRWSRPTGGGPFRIASLLSSQIDAFALQGLVVAAR